MPRLDRKTLFFYILTAILLLISGLINRADRYLSPFPRGSLRLLRHLILLLIILAWSYSIRLRILNQQFRRYLLEAGVMMRMWLVLRMFKWEFLPNPSFPHRMLWYCYYIPMLMIPSFGVLMIDALAREKSSTGWRRKGILGISLVLILCVLTNDRHCLVFNFPEGIQKYDDVYAYGWLYYVILIWLFLLAFYFVVSLIRRSSAPGRALMRGLPLAVIAVGILFSAAYVIRLTDRIQDTDIVAFVCIEMIAIVESLILNGVLPSNVQYEKLFTSYVENAWIVDRAGKVIYSSRDNNELPEEAEIQSGEGPVAMGDYLLNSHPVDGGRIYWLADVSRMNSYLHELKGKEQILRERSDLLSAEVALKAQENKNAENAEIFRQMEESLSPQLELIEQFLREGEAAPEHLPELLAKACVVGAFVKRSGNLLLISRGGKALPVEELYYCLRESVQYLKLCGIQSSVESNAGGILDAAQTTAAYRYVETVLEAALDTAESVIFRICEDGTDPDRICLNMELRCEESVELPDTELLNAEEISADIQDCADGISASILLRKGGECR